MNLILFTPAEAGQPLPRTDPRAAHLLDVLRLRPGGEFDAGLVNGPRGKGTVVALDARNLTLAFTWGGPPPPLEALALVVGLPRPQTARAILRDATTLGVGQLHFALCEKSDRSYARSTLWTTGEWRRHVLAGAAQSFDTRIPEVSWGDPLAEILGRAPAGAVRLALDNYESTVPLARFSLAPDTPVVLAIGPERGWSPAERAQLRAGGFTLAGLGPRVLRTETAVVAAITLVTAARGWPGKNTPSAGARRDPTA